MEEIVIKVEAVKIIGKIEGINERIELVMDAKTFEEWKDKIRMKTSSRRNYHKGKRALKRLRKRN